jgi:hypothetical protein
MLGVAASLIAATSLLPALPHAQERKAIPLDAKVWSGSQPR